MTGLGGPRERSLNTGYKRTQIQQNRSFHLLVPRLNERLTANAIIARERSWEMAPHAELQIGWGGGWLHVVQGWLSSLV